MCGRQVCNGLTVRTLRKIAIVGVGLLGGSIGLALRAAGYPCARIGIGRRRSSLARARRCGAIDVATLSFRRGLHDAQLAVVATPLGCFAEIFRKMAPHLPAGCIVTDVGSAKTQVVRLADEYLPDHVRFVGSHPVAGSERTGVASASPDLFRGAVCICLLYTSPSPRDLSTSRMPSSA